MGAGGHQAGQRLEIGLSKRVARRMHQQGWVVATRQKQEAVSRGAALEAVLHLKTQARGAEAPQADQAGLDLELDHPAVVGGAAHQ